MDDQAGNFDAALPVGPAEDASSLPSAHLPEEQFCHLREDVRQQAKLANAKRIELIRQGVVIEHPAFAQALNEVSWLLTHPGGNIGRGLLLLGDSGMGKTTFGKFVCAFFGNGEDAGRIVMFDASGARTTREVMGEFCKASTARLHATCTGPIASKLWCDFFAP